MTRSERYGGQLIHSSRDEYGLLEVVDDTISRSLHFGNEAKQSSMLLTDPLRLYLSYTRAMAAALLFQPSPKRVLNVGLGGGSLAKFMLHHFPQCQVDAVELRPQVTKLAHGYFGLPESPRLRVLYADAGDFMRNADIQRFADYDILFIDAFVERGIAHSVLGMSFFEACRDRLNGNGVLSMNLWSSDFIHANDILHDIRDSFHGHTLRLPVEDKANVIALATMQAKPKRQLKQLDGLARELAERLDVEFPALLRSLRKHNRLLSL